MTVDLTDLLDMHGAGFGVVIEPYQGKDAGGAAAYGAPVEVAPVWVDERRRIVRAAKGETLTVAVTVYAALATDCPTNSRVTLPSGRQIIALHIARRDGGGFDVPEHVEIAGN